MGSQKLKTLSCGKESIELKMAYSCNLAEMDYHVFLDLELSEVFKGATKESIGLFS